MGIEFGYDDDKGDDKMTKNGLLGLAAIRYRRAKK